MNLDLIVLKRLNIGYPMALLIAFGSAYQRRPNGSAIGEQIKAAMIFARTNPVNVTRTLINRFDVALKGIGTKV